MTALQEADDRINVKPYLKYSVAAHLGFAAAVWAITSHQISTPPEVYRIDFIGPTAGIINRDVESAPPGRAAAPASSKIAPENRGAEFAVRQTHHTRLPRPSILNPGAESKLPVEDTSAPAPMKQAKNQGGGAGANEGAGTSVTSDLPNFPFPWYITQLRSALWNQWSAHMPPGGGETLVIFSILPNGQVVDLRVESSSGDQSFDFVALSAVQNSEPFPPLPGGFREPFLKIHVKFSSQ